MAVRWSSLGCSRAEVCQLWEFKTFLQAWSKGNWNWANASILALTQALECEKEAEDSVSGSVKANLTQPQVRTAVTRSCLHSGFHFLVCDKYCRLVNVTLRWLPAHGVKESSEICGEKKVFFSLKRSYKKGANTNPMLNPNLTFIPKLNFHNNWFNWNGIVRNLLAGKKALIYLKFWICRKMWGNIAHQFGNKKGTLYVYSVINYV